MPSQKGRRVSATNTKKRRNTGTRRTGGGISSQSGDGGFSAVMKAAKESVLARRASQEANLSVTTGDIDQAGDSLEESFQFAKTAGT